MIRRKLWAGACFTLIGGTAIAQEFSPKASLGKPQVGVPNFVARGASPTEGLPRYAPRTYVAPTIPTYTGIQPATLAIPRSDEFASDMVEEPGAKLAPAPVGAGPMPNKPSQATPMPAAASATGATTPWLEEAFSNLRGGSAPCARSSIWVTAEYLNWETKGVNVPALLTAAPAGSAGTLDSADTTVVFGNGTVMRNWQSGVRVRAGVPIDDGQSSLEFSYLYLGRTRDNFIAGSSGNPGLFRPFLDAESGQETSQLIGFIDPINGQVLSGRVSILHSSDLAGGEALYRRSLTDMGFGNRMDLLVGYRYMYLRDILSIQNDLTAGPAAPLPVGTKITSFDRFEALNQFHGGSIGIADEWQIGCMTFGLRSTVALGVTTQRFHINGSTATSLGVSAPGGLLALPTNIRSDSFDTFSVVPEVGATLGYQVTSNLRVFGGYNCLYWTKIARAGEQIDRRVNSSLIPDPTGAPNIPSGPAAPGFPRVQNDFWVHGLSAGLEWRW